MLIHLKTNKITAKNETRSHNFTSKFSRETDFGNFFWLQTNLLFSSRNRQWEHVRSFDTYQRVQRIKWVSGTIFFSCLSNTTPIHCTEQGLPTGADVERERPGADLGAIRGHSGIPYGFQN